MEKEVYSECTDAEKKQFMQAFIERIDIFPERREDGIDSSKEAGKLLISIIVAVAEMERELFK